MMGRPFALWVVSGGLLYAGVVILLRVVSGSWESEFAAIAVGLATLLLIGAFASLTGKVGGLLISTIVSLVYLANLISWGSSTFSNPAEPIYLVLFSTFPAVTLSALFSSLSYINAKKGSSQKSYLNSPTSVGGLLTVGVVGFIMGGLLTGSSAADIITRVLTISPEDTEGAITMAPDSYNSNNKEFFLPKTVTVAIGADNTVRWINTDRSVHTVTSDVRFFDSGNMLPGEVFSFTFTKPGVYNYHCEPHPWMRGTVIVKEG